MNLYGITWPPLHRMMGCPPSAIAGVPDYQQEKWHRFYIERAMLALPDKERPKGFISFLHHSREISNLLWGDPSPDALWYFEFNPNAIRIINAFAENRWTGIAGCKSSSKSESIAWLCLMFFLIDPLNSKVLVGSKTIETAKSKIFATIDLAWRQACLFFGGEEFMPGEMLMSKAMIRGRIPGGGLIQKSGIEVIPGESSSVKKSAEKLQGYKAGGWSGRLMFACDELATMNHAIINTAIANLTSNENFKGVGGFNPDSEYDASRPIALPVNGFGSISVEDTEWKTSLGVCLHFDGTKSPNVIAGRNADGKYPWRGIYTRENLKEDTDYYIEKSAAFWQMVRGFWPPVGSSDCIYSAQEIRQYGGDGSCVFLDVPVAAGAVDPAWKLGGDRAMARFGLLGTIEGRKKALQITEKVELAEEADADISRDEQVAIAFAAECKKRGVLPKHAAFDGTGGGGPWGTLLRKIWSPEVLDVQFGGDPSELLASETEGEMSARDKYDRKVSELWFVGRVLVRSGQLKGIDEHLAAELTTRSYKMVGDKVSVESKRAMKSRTQKSPDDADAAMILVHLCRERLGLVPSEKSAKVKTFKSKSSSEFPMPGEPGKGNWKKFVSKFNVSYDN